MGEEAEKKGRGGRPPLLDGRGLAAFVSALEQGATVRDAAKAAGFAANTFYNRRRACPAFAAAWEEAVEISRAPVLIMGQNGRRLQKRRVRRARFDEKRKDAFLDHFAATCDARAAAEAAGISEDCVYRHRASDPAFAEAYQTALEQGYARLEAEAVRQRLEAQERLRRAPRRLKAEAAQEFERMLQLLREYRRPGGRIGPRTPRREHLRTRWSFEETLAEIDRKLKIFAAREGRANEAGEDQSDSE